MRQARLRWLLLLGVLQPGCSFYYYAAQNLIEAPVECRDRHVDRSRFRRLAEDAWDKEVAEDPPLAYAFHYGKGYRDGYADYLDYGGTGEPPAAAPFVYRTSPFETPEGRKDVEDWYAGFRRGAAAARASGLRENVIVLPLALPPANAAPPPQPQPPPAPTAPAEPPGDLLPFPRKAPPAPEGAKGGDKDKP